MKILILEDEQPAAERIRNLLKAVEPGAEILETLESINTAVHWLKYHSAPDLILQDIQLADGNSLEIFRQTEVNSPVIFTTAYHEYALEAFKVNSIDYLLKPVAQEELAAALNKFRKYENKFRYAAPVLENLIGQIAAPNSGFKERFMIRFGDQIRTVSTKDVAYFYTEDKINYLKTKSGQTYPVDMNLDQLEHVLDPKEYFRINRQFIISFSSIEKMLAYSKARVKISLQPSIHLETIVSTERSPKFKEWLDGATL